MTWSDVTCLIPAVLSQPDRVANCATIDSELARQCPGLDVLKVGQLLPDKPQPREVPLTRIGRALRKLSTSIVLYLEDDVWLAQDFGVGVEQTIRDCFDLRARTVVSLFSIRDRAPGYRPFEPTRSEWRFLHAQAVLMPLWVARAWGESLPDWAARRDTAHAGFGPDVCLGEICYQRGVEILVRYPNLVQHRAEIHSAAGRNICPTSPTFRGHHAQSGTTH
jgi:hypothetical protein